MTIDISRAVIPGATSDEFGVRVECNGDVRFALARYSKSADPDASMFGVTCHLRAVEADGSAVIRVSGRALVVSHPASIAKSSHRLAPEEETGRLKIQALHGAALSLLEEIAVERGNRLFAADPL